MDNLTHSLIGAVLGQAGLKRRTGLAMPALIIAANLPDLDAPCTFYGVQSLAMRRGITHGPIAGFLLPLVTGALSQLLPVWRWPGPALSARRLMRQKLAASGGWRALLLLAATLALLGGFNAVAGFLVAGAMLLFVAGVLQAVRVPRSTR